MWPITFLCYLTMVAPQMYFPMEIPSYQAPQRTGHCEFLEILEDELDTSNLHANFVGHVAKRRLLANWQRTKFIADAGTLLRDLNCLAPSVAKAFIVKPSVEADVPFRLINDLAFAGEETSYIAMSYAWHEVNRNTPKKIASPVGDLPFGWIKTVEHFPLPVGKGVFQAVLDERRQGEGLWFDQACINQEDETEKSLAIGAMDDIYRNARLVVIALDDIAATGDELFFLEQYVQSTFPEPQPDYNPNSGLNPPFMQRHLPFRSFIQRVLGSIWFERAWCAQEMRMGQSHVFLVRCSTDDEDDGVCNVIRFTGMFFLHMLVLANEDATLLPQQKAQIQSLLETFEEKAITSAQDKLAVQSLNTTYTAVSQSVSLVPIIAEIFRMKASGNPRLPEPLRRLDANRDKTSIALNMVGIPLALKAVSPLQRPTIEDECHRQLLLVSVAARDAVALCTTGPPLQLHDGSTSWLCRPTSLDLPSMCQKSLPRFFENTNPITQGSDERGEYVQLDLVFLNLPHRTTPNTNFAAHLHRAHEFVNLCIQYQIQSHMLWNTCLAFNNTRAPAMRNVFAQTLACVLDCGAEWFANTISHFSTQTDMPVLEVQTLSTLFDPQLVPQHYIHHPSATGTLSSLLHALASLIAHGIPWASGATERTHGPLTINTPLPSLSQPSQSTPHSAYHISPSPAKALIFAPFSCSKTLLVAVPDVIKGEVYKDLARGWILTSRSPYTGSARGAISWELKGKCVMLGDAVFGAALGGVGDSKNQRVYGPGVHGS
jgi:hypothetical protein